MCSEGEGVGVRLTLPHGTASAAESVCSLQASRHVPPVPSLASHPCSLTSWHCSALEEGVCVEHVLHDVQPTLSQLVCYVCCPRQQASCGLVCYGHSPMPVVFPTGGMMYCSVFACETDLRNVFHCRVLY